ncbi:MAG: glycosyltransferase family 9 protein [Christiangramia sp.]|uniref:glycosyltransferase family 9 protein n=1 Tax=Christiangramia sp. TaxID=1931228 RepID=UPI00324202F0
MKILVIQLKMIGDVLTSSVLFEALRKKYPRAELHYLVYRHTLPVLRNNPHIDKVIAFRREEHFFYLVNAVRLQKYDAVIDVQATPLTALVTGFSGATTRVSYEKWYTKLACNHVFSRSMQAETEAGAAIEKRLRLLSPLAPDFPKNLKPKIYLQNREKRQALEMLQEHGLNPQEQDLFMISILGSSQQKTYPPMFMARLLDWIVQHTHTTLLLNYIPAQENDVMAIYNLCEKETQERIAIDLYGKNLREFLALTSYCKALIGNEGGGVNMAKALDIPTFAIFSPELQKANWNVFEDGTNNVSVHLRDYRPELFQNKIQKELKAENMRLYREFKPELFQEKLLEFCQNHAS